MDPVQVLEVLEGADLDNAAASIGWVRYMWSTIKGTYPETDADLRDRLRMATRGAGAAPLITFLATRPLEQRIEQLEAAVRTLIELRQGVMVRPVQRKAVQEMIAMVALDREGQARRVTIGGPHVQRARMEALGLLAHESEDGAAAPAQVEPEILEVTEPCPECRGRGAVLLLEELTPCSRGCKP